MKVLVVLLIILVVVFFLMQQRESFTGEKDVGNIGNILNWYFYDMGRSWANNKTFDYGDKFKDRFFYENFPTVIEKPTDRDFPDFDAKGKTEWRVDTDEKKNFWDALKPYGNRYIDEALTKANMKVDQKLPVIHFRCSDFPFWCSPTGFCYDYHFQKYEFFRKALGDYKEVDIITCNRHGSDDRMKTTCEEYVNLLKNELNIKVNLKLCEGDALEDFARMFYAPLIISTGSSMSFIAGFFGNGKFITSGHVEEEKDGTTTTCKICEYGNEYNLLHKNVKDYYNVQDVHEKLK